MVRQPSWPSSPGTPRSCSPGAARTTPPRCVGLVVAGLVATAAATALALAMVWDLVGEEGEAVQVLGALLIVQLFTAVVPSLLRRLRRPRGAEPWIDELDAIAGRLERARDARARTPGGAAPA